MKTSTLLKKARNQLAQHGWCQGKFSQGQRCCAVGAMYVASATGGGSITPACTFVESLLERESLTGWNDAEGRTKAEVLELFDIAYIHAVNVGE